MNTGARLLERVARGCEATSEVTGRAVAWLVLAMVLVTAWDVAMRYLFQAGSVRLQELEWHLFALVFLLGSAYTLRHDGHVRVDIFFRGRRFGPRGRAAIDVIGTLLFLLPFCAVVIHASIPFVESSFRFGESSPDPGGLPHRWLLKAAIPLGFGLLMIQGVAMAIRGVQVLAGLREEGERG